MQLEAGRTGPFEDPELPYDSVSTLHYVDQEKVVVEPSHPRRFGDELGEPALGVDVEDEDAVRDEMRARPIEDTPPALETDDVVVRVVHAEHCVEAAGHPEPRDVAPEE